MSRGLGKLQLAIKNTIKVGEDYGPRGVTFADIRSASIVRTGGEPKRDKLRPTYERSLRRALKMLVDRGDVLISDGTGRPGNPYRYITRRALRG
jgi:hypothetical protein